MSPSLEWFPAATIAEIGSEESKALQKIVREGILRRGVVWYGSGENKEIFIPARIDPVIVTYGLFAKLGTLGVEWDQCNSEPKIDACRINVDLQVEALAKITE